jgi:hypothetical protein
MVEEDDKATDMTQAGGGFPFQLSELSKHIIIITIQALLSFHYPKPALFELALQFRRRMLYSQEKHSTMRDGLVSMVFLTTTRGPQ